VLPGRVSIKGEIQGVRLAKERGLRNASFSC